MKIIFAGGGTAGHINPALSICKYIEAQEEDFSALFIGTRRGLEKNSSQMRGMT
ncbi:MAG: glycosyltransferase [Clostridia bacterium]|nr:glycosyltransferase [Clostridia bacterium]